MHAHIFGQSLQTHRRVVDTGTNQTLLARDKSFVQIFRTYPVSRGILDPEVGSHFGTVFTSGIAGPEFKTYRIIMYSGGTFSKSRLGETPRARQEAFLLRF